MKIGIDISQIVYGSGVSFYTKELAKNLLRVDRENSYVIFGGSLRRKNELEGFTKTLNGNFSTKFFPLPPSLLDLIWNRIHIGEIERLIGDVDVFHSSDWSQPPTRAFKVTTVHDLSALIYPFLTPRKIFEVQNRRLLRVKEEIDKVIVPSEATKKDLVAFGVAEEKIRVIYEAAGEDYYPRNQEEISNVLRRYALRGKYILSVGVGGRKNTERLIKAFELASAGQDIKLVFVGRPSGKIRAGRGLIFLGQVPERDLPILFSGGQVFVYPSLYEGFGLPVLQALTCGTPVVTSDVSSLPEVGGDAAVYVDPTQVASIAEGIRKALRGRLGLINKGFVQAKKFSWEKTATETLKVYEEAKK